MILYTLKMYITIINGNNTVTISTLDISNPVMNALAQVETEVLEMAAQNISKYFDSGFSIP